MAFYHWKSCSEEVRAQVEQIISSFVAIIPSLSGIYLHGSLAMGCFNPCCSDLDLLAVTKGKIQAASVPPILACLLALSKKPIPVEISFLNKDDLVPWRHPAQFDLFYSEDWREQLSRQLKDGSWEQRYSEVKRDIDLSAHITIINARGVSLWGEAIPAVFPEVPLADYADSILSDVEWIQERLFQNPTYTVLNLCRVYAFFKDGSILSKAEGADWAANHLDTKWHDLIQQALQSYGSESAGSAFAEADIKSFYNEMVEKIQKKNTFIRANPATNE